VKCRNGKRESVADQRDRHILAEGTADVFLFSAAGVPAWRMLTQGYEINVVVQQFLFI